MPRRESVIVDPVAAHVFRRACAAVDPSLVKTLQERMTARVGRPRAQSWYVMLVLAMIAAIESNGELFLTRINRVAGRLTAKKQRQRIGMERAASYSQVDRALTDLSRAVEETVDNDTGEDTPPKLGMGLDDLASLIVSGVLPEHLKNRPSVAVDSTDMDETIAVAAHGGRPRTLRQDRCRNPTPAAKLGANESGGGFRIGDDGRIQALTFDPDAREGYRAGKNPTQKGVLRSDGTCISRPAWASHRKTRLRP